MKKTFLHISEEFEYTWLGKDNGMIPIYISQKKICFSFKFCILDKVSKKIQYF